MALIRTPRRSWVDAGLHALAVGGPDAVRIEALAKGLGVSKGGFYWHFDDRSALLDEMLDAWEQRGVDDVIALIENEGGDARAKLWHLFSLPSTDEKVLTRELAIRDWARRDKTVAKRLRRVDNRRMDYIRSLFATFCPNDEDAEARCLLAMALFIGEHFIAADHGTRNRADVVEHAFRLLLV